MDRQKSKKLACMYDSMLTPNRTRTAVMKNYTHIDCYTFLKLDLTRVFVVNAGGSCTI